MWNLVEPGTFWVWWNSPADHENEGYPFSDSEVFSED